MCNEKKCEVKCANCSCNNVEVNSCLDCVFSNYDENANVIYCEENGKKIHDENCSTLDSCTECDTPCNDTACDSFLLRSSLITVEDDDSWDNIF